MTFIKTILVRKRGALLKVLLAIPAVWVITTLALMDRSSDKDTNSGAVKLRHDVRKPQQHIGEDTGGNAAALEEKLKEEKLKEINLERIKNQHPRQEKLVEAEKISSKPVEVHEVSRFNIII